jgi:signal transduction histidine kinase
MQAQTQSNLAARIPSPHAVPPSSAAPALNSQPVSQPTPLLAESNGLAHDAGNLLAALGLYCDLLNVPGVLRPQHQHYATELRVIADRSSRLIRRLLATPVAAIHNAASPSTDAAAVRPSKLFRSRNPRASDALANTTNHAAMLLSLTPVLRRIAAGAADVTVTCQVSFPPLGFPSEIIERITVNLVRNAAEAIRRQQVGAPFVPLAPPGQIRVTLAVVATGLQLTVEDNGPGMSPTNVEAYLHPEPLPPGASHGFGHRIVHELAAASEGQLSIRVRPGQGTAFCLKWPIDAALPSETCPSDVPQSLSTV